MSIIFEERPSDSPYIETIMHGHTLSTGSSIRPAECNWHMVFVKVQGRAVPLVVGSLTRSGVASWGAGAEILWVKFKLGTFMPHLPTRDFVDVETVLPGAASQSFWLKGSAWQFPNFENVDTFVERLVRDELLVRDPLVDAALKDQPQDVSSRTMRHRFLQATGMPHTHIRQIQRARLARSLLEQGHSILDTVDAAGYFDQPHLTRSLRQWVGHTPAQIIRMSQPHGLAQQTIDAVADAETRSLEMVR